MISLYTGACNPCFSTIISASCVTIFTTGCPYAFMISVFSGTCIPICVSCVVSISAVVFGFSNSSWGVDCVNAAIVCRSVGQFLGCGVVNVCAGGAGSER